MGQSCVLLSFSKTRTNRQTNKKIIVLPAESIVRICEKNIESAYFYNGHFYIGRTDPIIIKGH